MLTYLTPMYNETERIGIAAMFVANGCEMQKMKHHRHNLFSTLRLWNSWIGNIVFSTLLLLTVLSLNIMWSLMTAIILIYHNHYFEVVYIITSCDVMIHESRYTILKLGKISILFSFESITKYFKTILFVVVIWMLLT